MKQTLLIVGGGSETLLGIRVAKERGLHVVVSDQNRHAPGFALADTCLVVDTYDVEATVEAARRFHQCVQPIHGVICIGSDVPHTVASVSHALGLSGIPLEAARLAMDKIAMKQQFACDAVPIPWFSPIESIGHLQEICKRRGFPLVMKPVDSRGARGVLRLTAGVDLEWAFHVSQRNSPSGRVMVEEFLPGPQISTESMILDGQAFTVGFSDRNYEFLDRYAPHMIENGGELPCHLPETVKQSIHELIEHAALSLGIRTGVVKGDIVVTKGKPFIIEIAPRLSGGFFCTHEIPLSTGVRFVEQAIRLALGEHVSPSSLVPQHHMSVAQRYIFPRPGRVVRIANVERATSQPGVAFCDVRVQEGDVIPPIDNHPARAGVVIATGQNREEAIHNASHAIETLSVETTPLE